MQMRIVRESLHGCIHSPHQKCGLPDFRSLNKPYLHLATQFNRDIPWDAIDMDFMNLNQSAHGDREHGFIGSTMRCYTQSCCWALGKPRSTRTDWQLG